MSAFSIFTPSCPVLTLILPQQHLMTNQIFTTSLGARTSTGPASQHLPADGNLSASPTANLIFSPIKHAEDDERKKMFTHV